MPPGEPPLQQKHLQIQATKLYDTLLNALLNIESSQIVSIHAKALDQGAALKTVKRKLSDLDKAKIDEQKRAVRSGFDMDILLFFGDKIIPFEDKFPRDTQLYRVMTTKPSDLAA